MLNKLLMVFLPMIVLSVQAEAIEITPGKWTYAAQTSYETYDLSKAEDDFSYGDITVSRPPPPTFLLAECIHNGDEFLDRLVRDFVQSYPSVSLMQTNENDRRFDRTLNKAVQLNRTDSLKHREKPQVLRYFTMTTLRNSSESFTVNQTYAFEKEKTLEKVINRIYYRYAGSSCEAHK